MLYRQAFYSAILMLLSGCSQAQKIDVVSVADFSKFIAATGYETEAEAYGWSIFQDDVYNFHIADGLNWRLPNGVDSARHDYPVTQVSYNDAIAYCGWAHVRLPSYEEYWTKVKGDKRLINENAVAILPQEEVNIVGNVWEITTTENSNGEIRLAGGSYLCSEKTCHGTNPNRKLFVDKTTGNTHIGFSVIR